MTATVDPLTGWDLCAVDGCPLADPDAPDPDTMDDSGIAHGVRHVNISDQWWTYNGPTRQLAGSQPAVLAVAAWLARRDGRNYCIRSTEHAGEWNGYQLLASDLLGSLDREVLA